MTFSMAAVVLFFIGLLAQVAVWGWGGLTTTHVTLYFVIFAAGWFGGMVLVDKWHERRRK